MIIISIIGLFLIIFAMVYSYDYFVYLITLGFLFTTIGIIGITTISCTSPIYYYINYVNNKVILVEESNYSIECVHRMSYLWFNMIDTYTLYDYNKLVVDETSNFSKIERYFNK